MLYMVEGVVAGWRQVISPAIQRLCFLAFLILALQRLAAIVKRITVIGDRLDSGQTLSARGQLLMTSFVVGAEYVILWLPVLTLRAVDADEELGEATLGWVSSFHCYLQDRAASGLLTVLVVSSFMYLRHRNNVVAGWAAWTVVGLVGPLVVHDVVWHLLARRAWLLPSRVFYQNLHNYTILQQTKMVICEKQITGDWLLLAGAEWVTTVMLVVLVTALSQHTPVTKSKADQHYPEGSKLPSQGGRLVYARGRCLLESVCGLCVAWALTLRPLLACYMYFQYLQEWSPYLDLPSHVLLMMNASLMPLELPLVYAEESGQDVIQETPDQDWRGQQQVPVPPGRASCAKYCGYPGGGGTCEGQV